jgi:nitrogenase molybdenum-iron protein NifN
MSLDLAAARENLSWQGLSVGVIALLASAALVIANTNARLSCLRHGIAHFRAGFPVYDRLGGAHRVAIGYRGTRDLIFQLANVLIDHPGHGAPHPMEDADAAAPAAG